MLPIAQELGLEDWPLACYNGALIGRYDQQGTLVPIFSHEVKKAEAKTLVARIKADFPDHLHRFHDVLACDDPNQRKVICYDGHHF